MLQFFFTQMQKLIQEKTGFIPKHEVRKAKTKRNTYVKLGVTVKKSRRDNRFLQDTYEEKYRSIYDEAWNFITC